MDNTKDPNNTTDNNANMGGIAFRNGATASPFTQKNIFMGAALFLILLVIVWAFFTLIADNVFDVAQFEEDEAVLENIGNDLESLSQDNAFLDEIDQTFSDILDEGAGISADDALDESSIAQEAAQADLSQTLDAFAADDAVLQELDQVFGDVLQ